MTDNLLFEDISRIKFLMGYDPLKVVSEQIDYNTNSNIISEQKLTPQQIASAKTKIQDQSKKVAESIFQELKKAMDIDGDNVLNDYDGTNEAGVVKAIKKITNKEILDYLNQRVKKTKQYGSLKLWINDELSNFDSEYGQIWKKLESLGYAGADYNLLLKAAGIVANVTGVKSVMDAGEGIVQLFKDPLSGFKKIIDAIRSFLGGVVGGVITTILDFTGIGKVVTSIGWGLLLIGDVIISSIEGIVRWPEIALSIINIGTTGLIGASVGKVLKPLMGKGGGIGSIIQKLSTFTWFKNLSEWISGKLSNITDLASSALKWIVSQGWWKKYIASSAIGKLASTAVSKVNQYLTSFTQSLATVGGAGSGKFAKSATGQTLKQKAIDKGAEKIKTKITTDFAKDLGTETLRTAVNDVGGENAQKIMDVGTAGVKLKNDFSDLAATNRKINFNSAGTIANKVGSVTKDATNLVNKSNKLTKENDLNEEIKKIKKYISII